MGLTLYGSPRSRTMRVLWTLAELGLDFEHIPLAWDDPALKAPRFLALNPAGAVPVLVDDGVVVSESLAINLHLAKRHGGASSLYPDDPAGEAQVLRWTLWAQGQLEPWVQQDARLARLRTAMAAEASAEIARGLRLLDAVLAGRDWLLGARFTVADLNVAAVLSPSRASRLDLSPYADVRRWLTACYDRPAAVATRERYG
jgi:glutathione S-transferase